jgi:hypothetical protein
MAIQISGTTVIDNSRNFIPVTIEAGSTVGTAGSVLSSTGSGIEWIKGGAALTVLNSNATLKTGNVYVLNTSGLVLTLPASPSTGDAVDILNNVSGIHTIARNGSTIMSLSENLEFGEAGINFKIWYTGSTWSLF